MFATQPDLQFLSTILILLGPFAIIFPEAESVDARLDLVVLSSLHDFAGLDDTFDFSNQNRANTHFSKNIN